MAEAAKLLLCAVLAVALAAALVAPPPRRSRNAHAAAAAAAGGVLYLAAFALGIALLAAPGVAALAVAGWLARGRDERPPGGDEDLPEPDEPIDWDEFDRLRSEWESPTRHLVLA